MHPTSPGLLITLSYFEGIHSVTHKRFRRHLSFFYQTYEQISPEMRDQIYQLIVKGGSVGTSYISEILQKAFLIGYAVTTSNQVVGVVTLKHPKAEYRKKIEAAAGYDLAGFLERGYTSIEPDFRGKGIADALIKGLIKRSKGQRVYTTIGLDNLPALHLTRKNNMTLVSRFINWRTGREIGLFVNESALEKKTNAGSES